MTGPMSPDQNGSSTMKRLILSIALLSSFTIPAAASVGNGLAEVRPHGERSGTAHTSKLRRTSAEVRKDPYWEPCLSYQRSWGPGACGDWVGPAPREEQRSPAYHKCVE